MTKQSDQRAYGRRWRFFAATALVAAGLMVLAAGLAGGWSARAWAAPQQARAAVMSAWRSVQTAGAYRFTADIQQELIPLPTAGNVGRGSKTQRLYLEGATDLRAETLQLALWAQGGSLLDPNSAAQVRVENDQTFVRQGEGEWQPAEDFTGGFAPGGDFMGFLAAATNIQAASVGADDNSAGMQRYTFDIDGPGYARHLRDNLAEELARHGALPRGLALDLPEQYVAMSGSGELWLAPSGLPARQRVSLDLPAAADADYRTRAEITIDFSYDQVPALAAQPPALAAQSPALAGLRPSQPSQPILPAALRAHLATAAAALPQTSGYGLVLLVTLACAVLLARSGRSSRRLCRDQPVRHPDHGQRAHRAGGRVAAL
ncbi:MAG: hypothetical protein V9H69_01170 [Anaerolineae bacterium]